MAIKLGNVLGALGVNDASDLVKKAETLTGAINLQSEIEKLVGGDEALKKKILALVEKILAQVNLGDSDIKKQISAVITDGNLSSKIFDLIKQVKG